MLATVRSLSSAYLTKIQLRCWPSVVSFIHIAITILDRSLSVSNSSTLLINPDLKEAFELKGWYDQEGKESSETTITLRTGGAGGSSPGIYIGQIKVRRSNRLPPLSLLSQIPSLVFQLFLPLLPACLASCSASALPRFSLFLFLSPVVFLNLMSPLHF